MTWLCAKYLPSCTINEEYKVDVRFAFLKNLALRVFKISYNFENCSGEFSFEIPRGVLFDCMRVFEDKLFSGTEKALDRAKNLSCSENGKPDENTLLRFILWAFCSSDEAADPNKEFDTADLKKAFCDCAILANKKGIAGIEKEYAYNKETKELNNNEVPVFAIVRGRYFEENFCNRVNEIYKDLGVDVTSIGKMGSVIDQLNKEKEDLKNQKHTSKYLFGALGGLTVGGILTEGTHRFLGAKRSRSSEVNKGKPSINKVNKGKPSSNKKGEQRAKRNLKKQKS